MSRTKQRDGWSGNGDFKASWMLWFARPLLSETAGISRIFHNWKIFPGITENGSISIFSHNSRGRPRPFTPYAAPKPHMAPPNRIWRCWLTCTKASSSPWCLTYKNLSFFHWGENFVLVSFFIIFLEKLAKTIDFLKKIWYNKL